MRLDGIGAEVRAQRCGIALGAVALLVATGVPAHAVEGVSGAATSVAQALKVAKKADKRSKTALRLAKKAAAAQGPQGVTGPQGQLGPPGPKGDTGAQGTQGLQGPPGSDAPFNGATAGGSLTGTYPDPGIAGGAVDTPELADFAVTGGKLADFAVGNVKLGLSSVQNFNIADGHVRGADLGGIVVRSATVSVPGGGQAQNGNWDTASASVVCQPGEVRLGGAARWLTNEVNDELLLVESEPLGVNGWSATGGNDTGAAEDFAALVICLAA